MLGPTEDEHLLRDRGLRLTRQRRLVLDILGSRGGLLSAEEIYEAAGLLNAKISLATVYRALAALADCDLVEQRYLTPSHERAVYALTTARARISFHCRGCGRLADVAASDAILQALADEAGIGAITRFCACVEGYCPDCARAHGNGQADRASSP